mmetsp:Transcript_645/g.1768  ORF Transcript_645/g.1768 Transcript_645/m.1768 type:complete len:81 (-) Transcript_645:1-243(-)
MFVAAVVHSYTFGPEEWQPGYTAGPSLQVSDNFAAGDFFSDVKYMARGESSSQRLYGKEAAGASEAKEGPGPFGDGDGDV